MAVVAAAHPLDGPPTAPSVAGSRDGSTLQTCASTELCAAVLRAATEHAIIGTDADGVIAVFNDGAERLLGYAAAEVIGRATPLLFHDPEEVAARAAALGVAPGFGVFVAAARHDQPETREWTYVCSDGGRVPVVLTVTPMHSEEGVLTGFLGMARDIGERKRAEAERARLLESERAARAAAERAAERMARLQRLTELLSEALVPAEVATVLLDQGVAALGASAGFVGLLTADGQHLEVLPSPRDPAHLVESGHRFHLDTGRPAAVAVRSRQPIFLESREALAAAYPHLLGGPDAAGPPTPYHAWAAVPLLVDSRAVGAIGLSFADPRRFDVEDRTFIVAMARLCAQALDRTRSLEAEQRARAESEQLKDEFFANVSHDLRTPVAAIKASIGVVLANVPPQMPAPLHRLLRNIDDASDRMAMLVNDVLELTRLQAGRVQLEPDRYDLREVVARAAAAIEPLAQSRGQRVSVSLPRGPVEAVVDEKRLERALLNLLSNAHKYGHTGGAIRVVLESDDGEAIVSVADDGPGVAKEEQARIFQRFYRTEPPPAQGPGIHHMHGSAQGSGLGLAIAQAMVELHRGRIWVESEPGRGATFRIALPVADAAPAPPRSVPASAREEPPYKTKGEQS